MASLWRRERSRSVLVALVAALALSSCSPRQDEKAAAPENAAAEDSAPVPHSALGDFLAGWLAHSEGDNRSAAEYFASALQHDPDNFDIMQRAFTLMVAAGKLDDAAPLAKRLIDLDSQSPLPLLVLGVRDARDNRFADAAKRFGSLRKDGDAVLAPLLVAWSQMGEGKTDEALATLRPLSEKKTLKGIGAFHSGLIDDLADRTDAAEQQYTLALLGQPNLRTIEAAGSLYQRTGHVDRAKQLYERYQADHPDSMIFDGDRLLEAGVRAPRPIADAQAGLAEALFDSATMMRQAGVNDWATVFCRLALAVRPDFPLAQMTMGEFLSQQGHRDEANALYRAIDAKSPIHDFGELRLAMNLDDSGDAKGAQDVLEALVKERPDSVDAVVTLGDLQRRHKHYAEAVQSYTDALAHLGDAPQAWALYYSRGVAFERLGDWAKAEPDFLKALDMQPDQPDVLNYLGYSWIDRGIHLDKARRMIERAVSLRPMDGAIVDSLGWALYKMGKYPEAVDELEHAVELKPEDATINEHLGDAYYRVGRTTEARYQWRRALRMDPEPEQLAGLKDKVASGVLPPPAPVKP